MSGNVWEWCQSLKKDYPYRQEDGRESLTASGSRVLRGGSWLFSSTFCRSANRGSIALGDRNYIGFRVVASPRP